MSIISVSGYLAYSWKLQTYQSKYILLTAVSPPELAALDTDVSSIFAYRKTKSKITFGVCFCILLVGKCI